MLLGIDYGKKRIGLALGSIYVKGAGVLDGQKKLDEIIASIKKICEDNEVREIIIGIPKLKSGDEGFLASDARNFGDSLKEKLNLEVSYEEETLTSIEAERILREQGKKYNRKSGKVDELAAVLLLEQYLNNKSK